MGVDLGIPFLGGEGPIRGNVVVSEPIKYNANATEIIFSSKRNEILWKISKFTGKYFLALLILQLLIWLIDFGLIICGLILYLRNRSDINQIKIELENQKND